MKRAVGALALLVCVSGCGSFYVNVDGGSSQPRCQPRAPRPDSAVVLMAQAVPTAPLVPCLHRLPEGWSFLTLSASNGKATFWLNSDRDGTRAVTISVRPRCDVGGATRVPSEQPGTMRYERISRFTPGYRGDRFYTFTGGCITAHFDLRGQSRGAPLASISQALGFVGRNTLRRQVGDYSDNRLTLDPPARSGQR